MLMVIVLLSKIIGFLRDISLSYFYGASNISDVYLIALTIPTVIIGIIGKGIYTGFIPMYTNIEIHEGLEKANQYTNNLVNFVMLLCSGIFLVGIIFTEPIVKLFAAGFTGQTLELAIVFSRITLVSLFFSGLIFVYTAFLQVKGIFIIPAMMGLPANIIVIGSFFLSSQTNVYVLAVGSVVATFSQFILLLVYSYKHQYSFRLGLNLKENNIKRMMLLALPVILGSSVEQINLLIDRTLASHIAEGGISALNYANTINLVVLGVIVSSITSVLYPKISKMASENNQKEIQRHLTVAINTINLFILPATAIYMLFPKEIIQLLFGRGEFDTQAIEMTSSALFYYSIGIIGMSHRELFSRVFYSLQDTKTPMINASLSMFVNIILNLLLYRTMGIGGLALGTSISFLLCSYLLFYQLRKKIGRFELKSITITFIKTGIGTILMGGISVIVYNNLLDLIRPTFALLMSIVIGLVAYIVAIFFMKIKEVQTLVFHFKKQIKTIKRTEHM